ncbi:hypothetical protein [Azospirillum doebereinerae]
MRTLTVEEAPEPARYHLRWTGERTVVGEFVVVAPFGF